MSAPQTIQVTANGITFAALEWAPAAATSGAAEPPLALLLHGYPDSAWTWRHLGPFLAERGWRAVAPFTRGYAPTDLAPNDRYLIADLADDALALHAALGGDARSVLIGHDWGAVTTWAVTGRDPSRFAKYVSLAVPPTPALLAPWLSLSTLGLALRQGRMSWYFIYNQLPGSNKGLDRVIPKLWRDWSPGYDAAEDLARVFESLHDVAHRRAALRYYRNNLQRGILKTFTVKAGAPALYLHGAQDGCMLPALGEAHPEMFVEGSRLEVVPGVGHFMQLEDPALINDKIAAWIGG